MRTLRSEPHADRMRTPGDRGVRGLGTGAGRARLRAVGLLFVAALVWLQVPSIFGRSGGYAFPVIKGPYLGERAPRDRAELFSPGVVSTRNHEYGPLAIRGDGREMFWAVQIIDPSGRIEEQKIWHTREIDGAWSEPARMPFGPDETRGRAWIGCPVLSPDGKSLYFLSSDPCCDPAQVTPAHLSLVWVKRASGDSWTEATPVPNLLPKVKNHGTSSFCFAANGNLYFDQGGTDAKGNRVWAIFCAEMKNGRRLSPRLLGDGIDLGKDNWCPCIAPDESYLIFASKREGGLGDDDLYISFKARNGRWTPPVNMGPKVNTPASERFASISSDGRCLFFARENDRTYNDYYWIDTQLIRDLKLEQSLAALNR